LKKGFLRLEGIKIIPWEIEGARKLKKKRERSYC